MQVVGEFPDTAAGQTSEVFVSLLLNGSDDDAATLQFLDDHVADGVLPDSDEQRLGQLGALNDLFVAATISHIVQVDPGSYAVITEAPDFVIGLVIADESWDEISCLMIE